MNANEFALLERLRESSSPDRWAAVLALAHYLASQPEQRLGQALVLHLEGAMPELFYLSDQAASSRARDHGRFVIRFRESGLFNWNGHEVPIAEAELFDTRAEAEARAADLCGPLDIVREGQVEGFNPGGGDEGSDDEVE